MKKQLTAAVLAGLLAVGSLPAAFAAESPSSWAQSAVEAARTAGIVPEQVDGDYTQAITRADFCSLAAAVYRAWDKAGKVKKTDTKTVSFTDTDEEDVLLCASLGVVNGVGGGRFAPENPLTRQQAACMLHRLGSLHKDATDSVNDRLPHIFTDGADIESWARADVYWVYNSGVMNGVSGGRFAPQSSYTHEQSIATMLRLYDSKYAVKPTETASNYTIVVDQEGGAGAPTLMHLEDAKGKKLLTDYKNTKGVFTDISLFGEWASLRLDDTMNFDMYNLKTGKALEHHALWALDSETVGWALYTVESANGAHGKARIVTKDGTLGTVEYDPVTGWQNGRAVVCSAAGDLTAIDRTGKTVWTVRGAIGADESAGGMGERVTVEKDNYTSFKLITNGRVIAMSSRALSFNQYSDTYIAAESNGWYALYNFSGKKLTPAYANALDEVGQDIYARWVSNNEYEYFRCTASGEQKTLFRVKCPMGRPGALATDGAGVYALRTDSSTVTCFDRFGKTLGTIDTGNTLDKADTVSFENGCIRIKDALYLPTGEAISK
ncbi:S-layer homology domain-containing protein [uncultured Agathobaculum sp.]|uniref:S-layer homology domain-containing protein n=1 Tax=uncultured Agathobaculum sp. TaxID=2048140 RepID=UPI00296E788F